MGRSIRKGATLEARVGGPARTERSELVRLGARAVAVGVAYYVAARLGLRLALVAKNVTPLWPPTGIAVVAFLILGRRVWPGVALAAFLVNLPISTNAFAAAATAAGNTLAPLVAALLLQQVGFRRELDRLRDAIAIVFLGALASMLISATIGTGTLVASGAIPAHRFPSAWAVWWAGDAMGVLVVAPFLLSLISFRDPPRLSARERVEGAVLLAVIAALSVTILRTRLHLLPIVVPFLGLAAWRFRQRGAAPAALIVAGIASWAAAHSWGPFAHGTLFDKMLTLQTFNAVVAFSSFVFAALVSERDAAQHGLERANVELEERVRRRTADLSAANEQLGEAQTLAHVGSWEWMIPEDLVSWSDEMFRVHGFSPGEFPVTFEKAIELVIDVDAERIRANAMEHLQARRAGRLPDIEYTIVRPDGAERVLLGRAQLTLDADGTPSRMVGTVQDVTEGKRAEREHRIAETLQRSLLPERLPDIPGVELAARYVPATGEMEVGGDWYDVVPLQDGAIGVAIGDVAGHGLRAAAIMGQLRMSLRAFASEERSAAVVIQRLQAMAARLALPEIATLIYLVFDPDDGTVRFANAGHPPPLVVDEDGRSRYLEGGLAPPLGSPLVERRVDAAAEVPLGSTLLLFTDGLVERRGASIHEGLERLRVEASGERTDLEALCDHLLRTMVGEDVADDIAILALRPVPLTEGPLVVRMPAEPHVLAPLRQTLRRWMRAVGAPHDVVNDVLVASGEACANVIQHAYGAGEGTLEMELDMVADHVEVTVRDRGGWRPPVGEDGGRGLMLMRGFMDEVDVDTGPDGTVVRMRRRLPGTNVEEGASHERAGTDRR